MFCNQCGQQVADGSSFCNNCGARLSAPSQVAMPGQVPYPVVPPPTGPEVPTDGKATASLVCGVLSVTFMPILASIPAIILGHMSRGAIKRSMGKLKGEGMALVGLILGYVSFVFIIPIILIVAAIAIPNLLRAKMAANEASAVGMVRTLNVANVTYASTKEQEGYAPSLQAMQQAGLIDTTLGSGTKNGYHITYTAEDSDNDGKRDKYFIIAAPITRGQSGQREFCSAEDGIVRYVTTGDCTVESDPLQ